VLENKKALYEFDLLHFCIDVTEDNQQAILKMKELLELDTECVKFGKLIFKIMNSFFHRRYFLKALLTNLVYQRSVSLLFLIFLPAFIIKMWNFPQKFKEFM